VANGGKSYRGRLKFYRPLFAHHCLPFLRHGDVPWSTHCKLHLGTRRRPRGGSNPPKWPNDSQSTSHLPSPLESVSLRSFLLSTANSQDPIITLILKDLAALHDVEIAFLVAQFDSAYSHSWYHDVYTQGAFALFGPAQFNDLYPGLIQPAAGGRLHIAGEAASAHHAWIAGALDSAKRAVGEVLISTKGPRFKDPSEWERDLPPEVDVDLLTKHIALSEARFAKRRPHAK
jgi:Flavin containing amine oxidoreductase